MGLTGGSYRSPKRLVIFTAAVLAALIVSTVPLPGQHGLATVSTARAQEPPEDAPEAVWRAMRRDWLTGWDRQSHGEATDFGKFTGVAFPSATVGFATLNPAGAQGDGLLRTGDGGSTWVGLPQAESFKSLDALGVAFLDENHGVVVGEKGGITTTLDSGGSWTPGESPPGTPDLKGVAYASLGVVVAVGDDHTILRSGDGGASWKEVRHDPTAPDLLAVAFAPDARQTGVAVGEGGEMLWTGDAGRTWTEVESGVETALRDVAFFATDPDGADLGVAVGDDGVILRTTDGGQNWSGEGVRTTFDEVDRDERPGFLGVALTDTTGEEASRVGYVVGERLTVLEMRDQEGSRWVPAPVDARALIKTSPFTGFSLAGNPTEHLTAVAVGPAHTEEGEPTAVAVGNLGAVVKRTPLDGGERLVNDTWWRCAPDAVVSQAPDAATEQAPDEVTEAVLCDEGEMPIPSAEEGTGPTPAGECAFSSGQTGAEQLPCVATWQPRHEGGEVPDPDGKFREDTSQELFVDENFDEGRRVVLLRQEKSSGVIRVLLFDPDGLVQKGVDGFGNSGEAEFAGPSFFGFETGVVNLSHIKTRSGRGIPSLTDVRLSAYDPGNHRLFMATNNMCLPTAGCQVDPAITSVSITGEFAPAVTTIPRVNSDLRPSLRVQSTAFDAGREMLYVVTETSPVHDQIVGLHTPQEAATTVQVTLHAFDAGDDPATPEVDESEDGGLVRRWAVPVEDRGCRTTFNLPGLGVSHDGDSIAFACQGHSTPYFMNPPFEPHKIVNVNLNLRGQRHPRELQPNLPGDVTVDVEPISGGLGFQEGPPFFTHVIPERELLAWTQPNSGATLYDYEAGGWIGSVPVPGIQHMEGDARTGRLYAACSKCLQNGTEPGLVMADTVNLPVDDLAARVSPEPHVNNPGNDEDISPAMAVVSPRRGESGSTRLLAADHSKPSVHIYEDAVPPAQFLESPDPDSATRDIDEAEASSVTRIGRASGYGARVWWTGLSTVLPGVKVDPSKTSTAEPSLTYDWLLNNPGSEGRNFFGPHLSATPAPPHSGQRELRLGAVRDAVLENGLSEAEAVGLFYDGGPADSEGGGTGEDVKRRRGGDVHDFFDAQVDGFCRNAPFGFGDREECAEFQSRFQDHHEGDPGDPDDDGFDGEFGPYEAGFEEFVDRGMREVDGDRRLEGGCRPREDRNGDGRIDEQDNNGRFEQADDPDTQGVNEADCWEEFDGDDPRCDEDADGNVDCSDQGSVEEDAGVTYASECADPGSKDASFAGSQTSCKQAEFGRTEASAQLEPLVFTPRDGSEASTSFSVGASGSETRVFRDLDEGMVVEVTATASDVEVGVPERGSLSIGEVRTTARAKAKGRPGTAGSWVEILYEDVVIRDAEGETRLACGRSDPNAGALGADPEAGADNLDRDGDGEADGDDALYAAGLTPDERFGGDDGDAAAVACDPHRVVEVINSVFTDRVRATTSGRDMRPKFMGSPGGAQAIVQRDPVDQMSDQVINEIFGLEELPGLQLTIYNDGFRANRVQIDLAAVFAESKYQIGDPRGEVVETPGSVTVELSDPAGAPLAGGQFALVADRNGDGARGSGDAVEDQCTTGAGGTCGFGEVDAGSYLVMQRSAPPGFLAEGAPAPVFVSQGASQTVSFVNAPNSAAVEVRLVDPTGNPLAGGEFALVGDVDGDAALDPTDRVAGSCATGGAGTCRFDQVALGAYVLHQGAAPGGLQTADDIAFSLANPGQVARITVVNGPSVASGRVEIIEIIHSRPTSSGDNPFWLTQLPGALAAILLRGWLQALLFALTGLLFGAPAYLAHRRRELEIAKEAS